MSRNETGMEGKTDSNQEPLRPRNQPRWNAGNELMPKEPAAQKTQLPSIRKEKLQRTQRPDSLRGCGLRAADTRQARTALGRWLLRRWGRLRPRVWGCAASPKPRGHSARIRTPPHDREQWAERDVSKGKEGQCRAGDSARSTGPKHPFRPGPPAASPRLLLHSPNTTRAAKLGRPTSLLADTAFLPAGRLPGVREAAARASRMGRATRARRARGGGRAKGRGRARKRRARREPGARGSKARGDPLRTRCRSGGFSVKAGAAPRFSVR